MGTVVVVARGTSIYLARDPPELPAAFPRGPDPDAAVLAQIDPGAVALPPDLVEAVRGLKSDDHLLAGDGALARALSRIGVRGIREATVAELRAVLPRLPLAPAAREREFALRVARAALERALNSPEEVLITLAREEERVERALGREDRAMASFLAAGSPALREYRDAWTETRDRLERHHGRLVALLERSARAVVPNLSTVVGEKAAARLVAAAGGVAPLGRMRSARLQLLGSRRRPSPERGPRYGLLYRAARMNDVPLGRRGAYARSLAALAAIAARADATTHREIGPMLVARRDRRVEALRRGRP